MPLSHTRCLETAAEISREAGALLLEMSRQRVAIETKGEFDLVTAADRASERLILDRLRANFPDHDIVAEEGGGHTRGAEYRWYVDPLDGTTNFAHGYPMFSVTMALERAGELVAGVVHDPLRGETFLAERGGGAYLGSQRISVSRVAQVGDSLCSTGFPSRKRHHNINVHFFYQLAMVSHGVRRGGSAALDLAYVAAGRLDGFWEFGLKSWDMAAGLLLVEEASGRISDMQGGPASLSGDHILASNGLLHSEILELFGGIFAGRVPTPMPTLP